MNWRHSTDCGIVEINVTETMSDKELEEAMEFIALVLKTLRRIGVRNKATDPDYCI